MTRNRFIKIVTGVMQMVEASIGKDKIVFTCNEIYRLAGKQGNLGTRMRNNYISHFGEVIDIYGRVSVSEIPIGFSGRYKREQDRRRLMALSIYLTVALDSKIYKRL